MKLIYLLPIAFFALSFTCSAQTNPSALEVILKGNAASDVSIEEIKKGDFSFDYYLNGKKIEAKWLSYTAIHVRASGEVSPPVSCSLGDSFSSAKDHLQQLELSKGDFLIIENIVVEYNGKKHETKKVLEVHL